MTAPDVQSHVRYPLTDILGSVGNVRVVRALANDSSPHSAGELARLTELSQRGVKLVLQALERLHVVKVHGSGRALVYTLDREHPLAEALSSLFLEERKRWAKLMTGLRNALNRHIDAVRSAWYYGSVARGEDTAASDLDIAVVVKSSDQAEAIREELVAIADVHRLRVSVTCLTPAELAALADDDPWWSDVVRDGRVIVGSPPEVVKRSSKRPAA